MKHSTFMGVLAVIFTVFAGYVSFNANKAAYLQDSCSDAQIDLVGAQQYTRLDQIRLQSMINEVRTLENSDWVSKSEQASDGFIKLRKSISTELSKANTELMKINDDVDAAERICDQSRDLQYFLDVQYLVMITFAALFGLLAGINFNLLKLLSSSRPVVSDEEINGK